MQLAHAVGADAKAIQSFNGTVGFDKYVTWRRITKGLTPAAARFANSRIGQDVDLVTLRLNYKFGGYGAPVAARY